MAELNFEREPILDESVLEELEGLGDPTLLQELHGVFQATAEETLKALDVASRAADRSLYAEAIHKLKGSSGSMGASALFGCCRAIDKMCKDACIESSDMIHFVAEVENELHRANAAFEKRLAASASLSSPSEGFATDMGAV